MADKLPTISIKGKEYVQVKDRVSYFIEHYKSGCIVTELLTPPEALKIVIKATIYPDMVETPDRWFVAHSQAEVSDTGINSTAALENCETSAVGRALGLMGIGVIESVASADEVVKAIRNNNDI